MDGMWEVVGAIVFIVVLGPLVLWLQRVYTRRKARRHERGEDVRAGVYLRGTASPYPKKWKQGSVQTGEWPLLFRIWHRFSRPVVLAGLTLLRRETGMVSNVPEPMVVFRLRDAGGGIVELATRREYADLIDDVLRADPTLSPGVRGRNRAPLWVLACAAFAALWVAAWTYLALAGEVVPARVLDNEDGYCSVTWERGGATHHAEVECADEVQGETQDVLAYPPPLDGAAADVEYTPAYVVVLAVVLLVPLGAWTLVARRRRGRPILVPPSPAPALVAETEAPRLERFELRYSTISETVARRAATERWADAPPPPWWERRVRTPERRVILRAAANVAWLLLPIGIVVVICWSSLAVATAPRPTREADATVEYVDGFFVAPDGIEVRYDVGGVAVTSTVPSLRRDLEEGDTVRIRYDPDDPSRARLVDDDGTARGVQVVAAVTAVCVAFMAFGLFRALRRLRALRRMRAETPRPMRYAIARGGYGELGMMLFPTDGDPRPEFVVPMDDPLPPDLPVAGTAEVRGELADGSRPLVTVGRHLVYPPEPLVEIEDTEALAMFVNADDPFGDPDDG